MIGLYIHVPFCLSKCPYCDFYSVKYSRSLAEKYKNAVIRNLEHFGGEFDTVYFGGGTPVLLWKEISEILPHINYCKDAEITLEANPCCATEQALNTLRRSGINRISFGVQSFDDGELHKLGRRHSAKDAENAIFLAEKCGFSNISADLMLAVPNQTVSSVKSSVQRFSELPLSHISAYLLKIEPDTPFASANLVLPDEDRVCEIYLSAASFLEEKGFGQYEISNFSKPGFESRHNLKYWRCEEYLGIGPAAHSYYEEKRSYAENNLNSFLASDFQQMLVADENPHSFDEYAMLKLRLAEGISFDECESFGVSRENIIHRLNRIPDELIISDNDRIRLTKKGFLLSNAVIGAVLGY